MPIKFPQWNTISISGYHIREAGSTAVQELAFTLADGRHYVEQALRRDLDVDQFAPRFSFFFNAHNDMFEEVAKYRAAREIWARMMRDDLRCQESEVLDDAFPRSNCRLFVARQTTRSESDAGQPTRRWPPCWVDVNRCIPIAWMKHWHCRPNMPLRWPCEHNRCWLMRPVSSTRSIRLGGSYFVETMTGEMLPEAERLFQHDRAIVVG